MLVLDFANKPLVVELERFEDLLKIGSEILFEHREEPSLKENDWRMKIRDGNRLMTLREFIPGCERSGKSVTLKPT